MFIHVVISIKVILVHRIRFVAVISTQFPSIVSVGRYFRKMLPRNPENLMS